MPLILPVCLSLICLVNHQITLNILLPLNCTAFSSQSPALNTIMSPSQLVDPLAVDWDASLCSSCTGVTLAANYSISFFFSRLLNSNNQILSSKNPHTNPYDSFSIGFSPLAYLIHHSTLSSSLGGAYKGCQCWLQHSRIRTLSPIKLQEVFWVQPFWSDSPWLFI